jgi:hypothetical protein
VGEKKGCSFLKKRTKKLLDVSCGTERACADRRLRAMRKSFLLLFFKNEGLPFFRSGKKKGGHKALPVVSRLISLTSG